MESSGVNNGKPEFVSQTGLYTYFLSQICFQTGFYLYIYYLEGITGLVDKIMPPLFMAVA